MELIGAALAFFSAFCYALGSVAATRDAQRNAGRGTAVVLSTVLTMLLAGGLWLTIGPPLPSESDVLLYGAAWFGLSGILATVIGRVTFFRSVELAGAVETSVLRRLMPVFSAVLAVLFLGERITGGMLVAFLLVFVGIALVVWGNLQRMAMVEAAAPVGARNAGRALAVGSAASYGTAYVTRKFGMQTFPDPLAGTFIGAVVGLAYFCTLAPFNARYRAQVAGLLKRPTPWQLVSAGALSVGQIALFAALKFTDVTVVAIIASVEMFLAAWLAGFVIRSEPKPGQMFLLASLVAMAGITVLAIERA